MIDSDPFVQWIVVPDDQQVLPPVDDDICGFGLKDFSSLRIPNDLRNEPCDGLLLRPDMCRNFRQGADTFSTITLSPNAGHSTSLPTPDSPSTFVGLFPPALSPDSSPNSVVSTPWLRTPETDPLLTDVANFTPVDTLWEIAETEEESCSITHFLDELGNSLEDIPSQVHGVMPEDIACTPQIPVDASLPSAPCTPHYGTPTFTTSLLPGTSISSRIEAVSSGQAHCTSLPPSPHISQSLFGFSPATHYSRETGLPTCPTSLPLSPLTTLSVLSRSPSTSPNTSPLSRCSFLSPALSPVPLTDSDGKVPETNCVSSTSTGVTSVKLQAKRNAGTFGNEGAPPCKIARRSKAKNIDEEEWNPGNERVKRPRAVSSSQCNKQMMAPIPNCPPDESSDRAISRGLGGLDATYTSCEICGQTFTRTSDYVRHLENSSSHPETRKVWPCPHCDNSLGRKDALVRHIKTLHPGRPVFIPEGILGSLLPEGQKEPFVQRMGQRKVTSRRRLRKDTSRYR